MDRHEFLEMLRAYLAEMYEPEDLVAFESRPVAEFIQDSIDALELVWYVEKRLKLQVGLAELGPAMATRTIGELADEVVRLLAKPPG